MNWGHKITIAIALFMGYILYLVYLTFQQNIDLVADDYYQQEIAYQDVINKSDNYHLLENELSITQTDSNIVISFPHSDTTKLEGSLIWFRPSEAKKDIIFPINSNKLLIPVAKLLKGVYKIKATWTVDTTSYFNEQTHYVQ